MELNRVKDRERLKARTEPYWQTLGVGKALGYRQGKAGGTWWVRRYTASDGKQFKTLGDLSHLPPSERYAAALEGARTWFNHLDMGGAATEITVREACERYAESNADGARRFQRYVYNQPIASVPLAKLTDRHVRTWRMGIENSPALVNRSKKQEPVTRPRSPATVNRDIAPMRAALNLALQKRDVLSDHAWKFALKPLKVTSRRQTCLSKEQFTALLAKTSPDLEPFCRFLCQIPLRPGALAEANVEDVDTVTGEMYIRQDKSGAGRRFILPSSALQIVKEQGKQKLPKAPLFSRWDGARWNKDSWKDPFRDAATAAEMPDGTTMYTLRHSCITHLAVDGTDLMTIARVAGTSVLMIEKHYGHLVAKHAVEQLERNAI